MSVIRASLGVGVAMVLLLGMVAAFGTSRPMDTASQTQSLISQELEKQSTLLTPLPSAGGDVFAAETKIERGDSLSRLLTRIGVDDNSMLNFLREDKVTQTAFRQMSPGKLVSTWVDSEGHLRRMLFPLNGPGDLVLDVSRDSGNPTAAIRQLKLITQIAMKSSEIRYSLFGATDAAGIPDGIATQLAEIFAGEIDFHRDLRKGDRFAVVYESITHLGKEIKTGRVLAAEFVNNGKTHKAVWFKPADSTEGNYFTPTGQSLRKAFLRSPIPFSRVTSGFSSTRFHPVLQTLRAHRGIDYSAPVGTAVKATGSGQVEFVGSQGGYGKVVILRHQERYTTLYGHLSGFAGGIRQGSRVSQGDVIGYVGATGLASGPHLHYEFRNNGTHKNPLSIGLPQAAPVAVSQIAQFQSQIHPHLVWIDRIRLSDHEKLALNN